MDFYRLVRPLLFTLEPERAHDLVFSIGEFLAQNSLLPKAKPIHNPGIICGLPIVNPLGLAAGMDKNARLLEIWKRIGFGFAEIGTVTPRPQEGNPKPRLFRVPQSQALINRLGFNNEGAAVIARRLESRPRNFTVGANIGKNKNTPMDRAHEDYAEAFNILGPHVDYQTINISSPNTENLRDLHHPELLKILLQAVGKVRRMRSLDRQPLFLKLSPDFPLSELRQLVEIAKGEGIDGFIATNTSNDSSILKPKSLSAPPFESGGISGKVLRDKSQAVTSQLLQCGLKPSEIISCGGITTPQDMQDALKKSCACQIYTALVYEGPQIISRLLRYA